MYITLQIHDPLAARIELDEALDFRGNFYFGAVSDCCQVQHAYQEGVACVGQTYRVQTKSKYITTQLEQLFTCGM